MVDGSVTAGRVRAVESEKDQRQMAKANALQKPLTPSAELSAVIGAGPHTRAEATAKLWSYIKDNGCQDPKNRREIVADTKLQLIFEGAPKATMFEVPKHLNRHLT